MFQSLHSKIEYLLSNHKVVVLRTQGLAWQEDFVKQLSVECTLYNFAEPILRHKATYRKEEFLSEVKMPALFQDVQYVDGLFESLHNIDASNGSFLIVSKQSCNIMEESCANDYAVFDLSLAIVEGRVIFEANELKDKTTTCDVYDKILSGYLTTEEQAEYLQRFMQYDLKDFTVVSDDLKFYRFMCSVAACCGNVMNYAYLGKMVDVSSPTAKQWLRYLEGAGLVVLLHPIEGGSSQRLTKAPKVYFRDTGLACRLLNINSRNDLLNSNLLGNLYETYAVMQLREAYLQNGLEPKLSYYRDSNAKEINLLLQCDDTLHPIEIKRDLLNAKKLQKKFRVFRELLANNDINVGDGYIICDCKEVLDLGQGLWQVPANLI